MNDLGLMKKNPSNAPTVVQKFGGTSIGKFLSVITNKIVPSYIDAGNRVILVCSARSGESKSTGTTSLLLRAALEALQRDKKSGKKVDNPLTSQLFQRTDSSAHIYSSRSSDSGRTRNGSFSSGIANMTLSSEEVGNKFNETVDLIKETHLKAAREMIADEGLLWELEDELIRDCERLRSFLMAAQIIDEISARSKDIIMGVGERLSCRIVTAALIDQGIEAEMVSLENIVEGIVEEDEGIKTRGGAPQLSQDFYDRLSARLGERLAECGDVIPVVTGYFGTVPGSLLAQVGRGYTDLCAALCAVGVNASELQVWKEVDGIFTADPRKVKSARLLSTITPDEAAELTYYGSEVIHPFTMEQVIRHAIPIRIKNVENPLGSGTIIFPDAPAVLNGFHDDNTKTQTPNSPRLQPQELRMGPTAVTIKDNTLLISIKSNRKTLSHGFFQRIFETLDRYGIIVDLIATSEVAISMAINGSIGNSMLDRIVTELSDVGEVQVKRNLAILSLVGKRMQNLRGIAGKMFSLVAEADVNLEMISQGASEINISCVIEEAGAVTALNAVHMALLTEDIDAEFDAKTETDVTDETFSL